MPLLSDLLRALDDWYPPATAESWDAVGLSCGDPGTAVDTVLVAVDCVPDTVDEAIRAGAQLLLTHHPLFLSGVHGVPATDPKGAMAHRMIRAGVAHFAAHTNADVAEHGYRRHSPTSSACVRSGRWTLTPHRRWTTSASSFPARTSIRSSTR